jgi:hypothetical protein
MVRYHVRNCIHLQLRGDFPQSSRQAFDLDIIHLFGVRHGGHPTTVRILSLPKGEADFVRRRRNKRGGTSKCEKTAQAVSSKSQKILAAITDLSVTAFLSTHLHYPRYAWFIPFWTLMIEICLGFGDWDLDLESEFGNWIWSFRLDH